MYLHGSKLEASYPISTLLPGVNLNATVLSHGNSLDFGLMGDMHSLPDLDLVAQCMVSHFDKLQLAVLGKSTAKKARKVTPKAKSKARSKAARGKAAARRRPAVRPKSASRRAKP